MRDFFLVEERSALMLSTASDGGEASARIARFLKPTVRIPEEAAAVPFRHLLRKPISQKLCKSPLMLAFKGWRQPHRKWKQWVSLLLPTHASTWKKSGILNAIMASVCKIQRDQATILGLVECWCEDTATFVFEWGEATVTLQDVLVLGGFSILGESVDTPLAEPLKEIEGRMVEEKTQFWKQKAKKASHEAWINHYMGSSSQLEHVAFLSLWVSRYVLPLHPFESVGKHAFSIAARLAEGIRVALGPGVLASLYRDLGLVKRSMDNEEARASAVGAPFQLLQTWAWERFPPLRPKAQPNLLCDGEPRARRWDQLKSTLKLAFVRNVLKSEGDFQWRPYEAVAPWVDGVKEEKLQCLAQIMRASELVGLNCWQHYHPHRVARQFGLDQDLPGRCSLHTRQRNLNKNYTEMRNSTVSDECGVSFAYSEWWKKTVSDRRAAIKRILKLLMSPEEDKRRDDIDVVEAVPPGFSPMTKKRNLEEEWDDDNLTLAERQRLKKQGIRSFKSVPFRKKDGNMASAPQRKRARSMNKREQNEETPCILLDDEESTQEQSVCVVSDVEETEEADGGTGFTFDCPIVVEDI